MRHHDEIRRIFQELRSCETVIILRADPNTDLSNRGRDHMRADLSPEEIGFRPGGNLLTDAAHLFARRRRQYERVVKICATRFEKAGAQPDVESSGSRLQPLGRFALRRLGRIPRVEGQIRACRHEFRKQDELRASRRRLIRVRGGLFQISVNVMVQRLHLDDCDSQGPRDGFRCFLTTWGLSVQRNLYCPGSAKQQDGYQVQEDFHVGAYHSEMHRSIYQNSARSDSSTSTYHTTLTASLTRPDYLALHFSSTVSKHLIR